MLDDLPTDALKLVVQACLLPTAGPAAAGGNSGGSTRQPEGALAAVALRMLAALRCVSRHVRQAVAHVPATVAAPPRPELAAWLGGLTVRGLHFACPPAAEHSPWMPGHSLTAWLNGLQISGGLAMRRALQLNLPALAETLQVLTGVPLSPDLPIPHLSQLRTLGLVNSGEEEVLRLRPLAGLQHLEELSARGYYHYDLGGLPVSVLRLRLHWQGGGGRVRIPPGVLLEILHIEGMDLFLPHTVLMRCRELVAETFALFLALPASPTHRQAGQLGAAEVACLFVEFLRACPCSRMEVVGNLLRIVQPQSDDYDFRSMTQVVGRCVEDGGSSSQPPNLELTTFLSLLQDFSVISREQEVLSGTGYRQTAIKRYSSTPSPAATATGAS